MMSPRRSSSQSSAHSGQCHTPMSSPSDRSSSAASSPAGPVSPTSRSAPGSYFPWATQSHSHSQLDLGLFDLGLFPASPTPSMTITAATPSSDGVSLPSTPTQQHMPEPAPEPAPEHGPAPATPPSRPATILTVGSHSNLSPALPESPTLLPPTLPPTPATSSHGPSPTGRMSAPLVPLPAVPGYAPDSHLTNLPPRLSSRRLGRCQPSAMTESLDRLSLDRLPLSRQPIQEHHLEYTDILGSRLGAVPEDEPALPSPTRSSRRERPQDIDTTLQRRQLLDGLSLQPVEPRRASLPSNRKHIRERSPCLPRSPSMPVVTTQRMLNASSPNLPVMPASTTTLLAGPSTKAERHLSASSSVFSDGSKEWLATPDAGQVSTISLLSTASGRTASPVEYIATRREKKRAMRAAKEAAVTQYASSAPPDLCNLLHASDMVVVGEDGRPVRFGDLVSGTSSTIVVFVRHWLSSFCAQYIKALMVQLSPELLASWRARLIIIGHGSPDKIAGFRAHFDCPFPVYTDSSRRLHYAFGLLPRPLASRTPRSGEYVSRNPFARAAHTLQLAARLHGFRSGDRDQLGGEFVFAGSFKVVYAHRMASVADHGPVKALVKATAALNYQRTPAASRSCLSLPLVDCQDGHNDGHRQASSSTLTLVPSPTAAAPAHGARPTSAEFQLPPGARLGASALKGPYAPGRPRAARAFASDLNLPLHRPRPPLTVTKKVCEAWQQQHMELADKRRAPPSTYPAATFPTYLDHDHPRISIVCVDDIDPITGEIVLPRVIPRA